MLEELKYKQKIILLIAIVLLITFISLLFIYTASRRNLISGHRETLEKTAKLTASIFEAEIENVKKTMALFNENRPLTESLHAASRLGRKHYPQKELSENILRPLKLNLLSLYDTNGKEIIFIDRDHPPAKSGSDLLKNIPYVSSNKIISGYAIDNGILRILSIGSITYKPGPSSEGRIGYVKIGSNIDWKTLNFIKKISGNDIFVIKGDSVLLSTQPKVSSFSINGDEMHADDIKYSIKSIPLKSIYGEETGALVIALSQKDLASALKHLDSVVFLMAFGSLSISVILGITLIRTLTDPLNRLIKYTEQVGRGSYPAETTFKGSDEVAVLGRHFLEMTKKLKTQKDALDSYTTGLEDIVMKRTHELLDSKEEWVRTFNSISDFVVILDKNHRIVRANKALLDRLDTTKGEIAGKKCYEVFCGDNAPAHECPIIETLRTGEPSIKEIHYGKLAGFFLVTASPLIGEHDDIIGSVYVVKDITERHNIQRQMMNAEKLASLGQMAAGFAHEINNPMASIAGCSELLIDRLDSDQTKNNPMDYNYFHEYLNIIYREAFRCKDIIRGMLRFSRKQFEKGSVVLSSILHEIPIILDHLVKSQRINVTENYGSKIDSILADEGEIRQLFLALIVNALDAMPDGGTLTIRTWDGDGNIYVSIKDTGAGIPAEIKDRIFEPFFTTKPVGKGTGLGLFIAFNIVKNCQGKTEVSSSADNGTEFTVTFPITPSPTA